MRCAFVFSAALLSATVAHAAGYLMDRSAEIALAKSERAWISQCDFSGFWNPLMRGAQHFNPPAVRSISPYTIGRTELVLAVVRSHRLSPRSRIASTSVSNS